MCVCVRERERERERARERASTYKEGDQLLIHLKAGFLGWRMGPAERWYWRRREHKKENYKDSESSGKKNIRGNEGALKDESI